MKIINKRKSLVGFCMFLGIHTSSVESFPLSNRAFDLLQKKVEISSTPRKHHRYILTGACGAGKTTLINELAKRGHAVVHEAATDILNEDLHNNIKAPWGAADFNFRIISLCALRAEEVTQQEADVFFDRGPFDSLSFAFFHNQKLDTKSISLMQEALSYYDPVVFFIDDVSSYQTGGINYSSREAAAFIGKGHEDDYASLGFEVLHIPAGSVEERVQLITDEVSKRRFQENASPKNVSAVKDVVAV